MTEPLFLDTDCFSTFLVVGKENLVLRLYVGRVGIPQQVYEELRKVYMRDILPYIRLYHLQHRTSADIMAEALEQHLINEGQGNVIWRDMMRRNRKLPANTFSEFLAGRK